MAITVFGSINMDLVARTARLPLAGETLPGSSFFTAPGGKGANQAVACARLGAHTRMVGKVGGDVFSQALLDSLQQDGVDTTGITVEQGQSSGVALIMVDSAGQNMIVVVPGANGDVGNEDLLHLEKALGDSQVLLLQLEIPMPSVMTAARMARQRGTTVILDPAPAVSLPDELYRHVDIITPNETEASTLVGFQIRTLTEARKAAAILLERGAKQAIIKMGGSGAYWTDGSSSHFVEAYPVKSVDSVGAGDAFNGALAAALAENRRIQEALQWAAAAGALSTTRHGAQPSMPERAKVMQLIERHARS